MAVILTGEMDHPGVAAGHELDVHRRPCSRGVRIPGDMTLGSLVIDGSRTGLGGVRIRAYKRDGGEKGGENSCREHVGRLNSWNTEGDWVAGNAVVSERQRKCDHPLFR